MSDAPPLEFPAGTRRPAPVNERYCPFIGVPVPIQKPGGRVEMVLEQKVCDHKCAWFDKASGRNCFEQALAALATFKRSA